MNLISNNKKKITDQSPAEKENNRDRKSLFEYEMNASDNSNSMFIVDWQIRDEKTTIPFRKR